MLLPDERRYTGFKHHAKVQTFRLATVLFAWGLLALTFVYRPEWIRHGMRVGTRAIEAVGDALPASWGAHAEIILRELGGFLWIQITAIILAVRAVFWLIGAAIRR